MLTLLVSIATVFAWGIWLVPSQNIAFKNPQIRTFYVALSSMLIAILVTVPQGFSQLTFQVFWPPFLGGIIWAVSGLCAFAATTKLGMARASGIWSPLNIVVSLLWGAILFDEFADLQPPALVGIILAVLMILAAVALIISAKRWEVEAEPPQQSASGLLLAVGAGFLWGSYFLPIKFSAVSLWLANLPLTVGIFVGSVTLLLLTKETPKLDRREDYLSVCLSGVLWSVGNYGMLLLVESLGAGRGFTIAQLSLAVNALVGIYWLKDPPPKSRAAALTFIGCILAMIGGIALGNIK